MCVCVCAWVCVCMGVRRHVSMRVADMIPYCTIHSAAQHDRLPLGTTD